MDINMLYKGLIALVISCMLGDIYYYLSRYKINLFLIIRQIYAFILYVGLILCAIMSISDDPDMGQYLFTIFLALSVPFGFLVRYFKKSHKMIKKDSVPIG